MDESTNPHNEEYGCRANLLLPACWRTVQMNPYHHVCRYWCRLLAALLFSFTSTVLCADVDFAPFFSWEAAQDGQGADWRAAGPLFEHDTAAEWYDGDWRITAFPRPFWVAFEHQNEDRSGVDALWPLAFSRHRGRESVQRILLAVHSDADTASDTASERWWLLPVFFTGQVSGGHDYLAVFPIGGTIGDIAGYDSVRFLLFPLYLRTVKGLTHSASILWPVLSLTVGPAGQKWRIFPLYGENRLVPAETRRFFLWPFIHTVRQERTERSSSHGRGFFILPAGGFYRQLDSRGDVTAQSWSLLWPFFSGHRSESARRLNCPWPFVRIRRTTDGGVERSMTYLWPFWGEKEGGTGSEMFLLWPFFQRWENSSAERARSRGLWIFPFFYSVREQTDPATHGEGRGYWRFWPLASSEFGPEYRTLTVLALWPQRRARAIQRSYAPFWTFYRYSKDAVSTEHELLWGLWQYESSAVKTKASLFPLFEREIHDGRVSVSILKGLFGWTRHDERIRFQGLWLFGR